MVSLDFDLKNLERQAVAPSLVRKMRDEYDDETLAEIAAEVEMTVMDESRERDVGKHGGIAVLYLVIDRLASDEYDAEVDDET